MYQFGREYEKNVCLYIYKIHEKELPKLFTIRGHDFLQCYGSRLLLIILHKTFETKMSDFQIHIITRLWLNNFTEDAARKSADTLA